MSGIAESTDSTTRSPIQFFKDGNIGIVLSGGGSRAAYQVGALKALISYVKLSPNGVSVIVGSSIGAVNGILFAGCLKAGIENAVQKCEEVWRERSYRNTFAGSPSRAFVKALKIAILRYSSPKPVATSHSIFDPSPLIHRIDDVLEFYGGLTLENRDAQLKAVAVMTTVEGAKRRPLLFVSARSREEVDPNLAGATFSTRHVERLTAKHGLASAALPSVLPSVELDADEGKIRLVDGGISENVPVDPAVRLGADRVIVIDVSGRGWWHDRYGKPHDTRPEWEIPAGDQTYCFRPPETFIHRPFGGLGPLLKQAVQGSTRDFIAALGPTWPIFSILRRKMGEELAYEVMSYVALHRDYLGALVDLGEKEMKAHLESAM